MSDNKNYQGNKGSRGATSSREEKSGAPSKRFKTSDGASKDSKGFSGSKTFSKDSKSFSSSKYEKKPAPSRRYRGDDATTNEGLGSKEEKNKVINKRNKQTDDNGSENKKREN